MTILNTGKKIKMFDPQMIGLLLVIEYE